jgi:hypothetical protein
MLEPQSPDDLRDEVRGTFESADGQRQKTTVWRIDDYPGLVAAGQWPGFFKTPGEIIEQRLGPGYRQVSATLNGEPLADTLGP